jgi:oxygen-independent coproporphyrinogen-3 oxidase
MVTDAGYVYIGMDHFALPGDELARAKSDGTLHRTFQGYTTHAGCELVGFGVSSIGHTGRCLSQNAHDIREYQESVAGGHIHVARGVILDDDDVLRAEVINSLMCFGELDMPAIEHRYGIDFEAYFDAELERLEGLQSDGLVRLEPGRVSVTPRGWMLVRNICASFDRYLPEHQADRFSRTI